MTPDPQIAACAEIVQRGDVDRFRAAMAAPVAAREVLFPIYAMNVEIARAPWVTQEPLIAQMRLQWWMDALEEIETGAEVRKHEVTTPLARVLSPDAARIASEIVRARYWDIEKNPFDDESAFVAHIEASAGALMRVAGMALGAGDAPALGEIGYAQGLAAWFQAIPELEARGRIPLVDGRPEAIAALARGGLKRLQSARVPKPAKPAALAAWQAGPILRQVARDPQRVAAGQVGLSPAGARLRLIGATIF